MFRRVLVPLDGSPAGEQALPIARTLAAAMRATVYLVCVVPLPEPWALMGAYAPQADYDAAMQADEQAARAALEGARAQLATGGLTVCTDELLGDAGPALQRYEQEQGIDLVVLGAHHHAGPARLALGRLASYLLRHGRAPLLLVGGGADPVCLRHAVLPLDGSAAHEAALRPLLALAPAVVQWVSLLRVVQHESERAAGERYLADVAERLASQSLPVVERRVVVGVVAGAIHELAGTERLVVMATHAHDSPLHWLASSVAERVVHERAAAVLLLRTGNPAGTDVQVLHVGEDDVPARAGRPEVPTALEG